ncbi:hypothetical protein HNR59_004135 [Aquamicrobium lusatiense]|uniref:Uncharacterized protein n=1 Tax=Aquamicrobium lusatiense TaxID=89772 RepID=A0A7W9S6K7_9HYPH|nr:hypothetical protein [Aquamicrobium lusatiense]
MDCPAKGRNPLKPASMDRICPDVEIHTDCGPFLNMIKKHNFYHPIRF